MFVTPNAWYFSQNCLAITNVEKMMSRPDSTVQENIVMLNITRPVIVEVIAVVN